jgi:predicted nucleotidyltransferase
MYREAFDRIVDALPAACLAVYGDRLKALALFGSVARGTMRPDSDVDLFVVVEPLPDDPAPRRAEFEGVERRLAGEFVAARAAGVNTLLAPVLKTPAEMRQGSFLHLDLTDQARILHDPQDVLRTYLDDLAARLKAMGAKRVYKGGGYYWVLKPDYRWGDRIEL